MNHAFIAGCRDSGAEHLRAPKSTCMLLAALATSSQAALPQLGPHSPTEPPWDPRWVSASSRGPGDSVLQGCPFPQCLHWPLCSCEESQCSLPAGWTGSLALPKASALSDGDAGVALGTLLGPSTPQGCRVPHQAAPAFSSQLQCRFLARMLESRFLLLRSVRMGASLSPLSYANLLRSSLRCTHAQLGCDDCTI